MNPDRELIELAALAAGIEVAWSDYVSCLCLKARLPYYIAWNPLVNDGDNRRLQIAIKAGLRPLRDGWAAECDDRMRFDLSPNRAVVLLAADIGQSKAEAAPE